MLHAVSDVIVETRPYAELLLSLGHFQGVSVFSRSFLFLSKCEYTEHYTGKPYDTTNHFFFLSLLFKRIFSLFFKALNSVLHSQVKTIFLFINKISLRNRQAIVQSLVLLNH